MVWPAIFFIVGPALAYAGQRLLMQAWQSGYLLWFPSLPFGIPYAMLFAMPFFALTYWYAWRWNRPVLQQLAAFGIVQLPIHVALDILADLLQRIDPYGPLVTVARHTLYDILIWLGAAWFAARASRPNYAPLILVLPMMLYVDARFWQGLVYKVFHYSYILAAVGWLAVALLSVVTLVRFESNGKIPIKHAATLIALGPLVFSLFHLTEFRLYPLSSYQIEQTSETELIIEFFANLFINSWSQAIYIIVTGALGIGFVWVFNRWTCQTDSITAPGADR